MIILIYNLMLRAYLLFSLKLYSAFPIEEAKRAKTLHV